MAEYGGFFLKGLAGSLQGMPQRLYEIKWKKKQEDKLQKKQDELMEITSLYSRTAEELGADGWYSDDDFMKLNTIVITGGTEFQDIIKGTHNHIQGMKESQVEKDFELVDSFIEMSKGMNLKDLDESLEKVRRFVKSESALNKLSAYENVSRRKHEIHPPVETFPTAGAVTGAYPEAGFKYTEGGYVPTFREPEEQPTEIDKMEETKKWLDSAYATGNAEYFNRIAKEKGVPTTFDTYKQEYKPEVSKEQGTEGEITAGQKRSWDMASSVMFGSSDWVTGISKPGIISQAISNKLNMGQVLTEDENTEIRNNYNAIKETLPNEIKSVIESQLQRYGISLETPPEAPIPELTPEQPGLIQKGVTAVKDFLGMKGAPPTEEIPTPKVSPGAKEAMIPLMTKKELEDAIKGLDPSDPMYELLYDEAVKRGYITK